MNKEAKALYEKMNQVHELKKRRDAVPAGTSPTRELYLSQLDDEIKNLDKEIEKTKHLFKASEYMQFLHEEKSKQRQRIANCIPEIEGYRRWK